MNPFARASRVRIVLIAPLARTVRMAWPAIFAGIVVGACDPVLDSTRSAEKRRVSIYVAASLNGALERVLGRHPPLQADQAVRRHNARLIAAASSLLARQLERGATGDVFISANRSWMSYLQERGRLVPGSRRALLGNRLVLVRASGERSAFRAGSIPELDGRQLRKTLLAIAPRSERFCIGDPAHVPAGIYARQALESSGVWQDDLDERILPGADARRTLWYLAHGGCAAGIVYRTDVQLAGDARKQDLSANESYESDQAAIPIGLLRLDLHAPIVYEIALLNEASPAARSLYDFLFSREAQEIFQSLGFVALD